MNQLTIFDQPKMNYQTFKGLAEQFERCKSVVLRGNRVTVMYTNGTSYFPISRTDKMEEVLINLKYTP